MWSPAGLGFGSSVFPHVNDMARACRDLKLVLFADDTNIFAEDRSPLSFLGG